MSIYPKRIKRGGLVYKWQVAQLDLPIPDDLMDQTDKNEWHSYADNISPGRLILKFAQALDQFHALVPQDDDFMSLNKQDKLKVYAKWEAASSLMCAVTSKLRVNLPRDEENKIESDISEGINCIVNLLSTLTHDELGAWQQRAADHRAVDKNATFLPFLNHMSSVKRAIRSGPTPANP